MSIESPSFPINDSFVDFFDWAPSGVRVTPRAALQVAAVWRAVTTLARDVAKLPLKLYRRKSGGGRDVIDDHPVAKLLRKRPNPEINPADLKSCLVFNAVLHGNGYLYVQRTKAGVPIALWPLDSRATQIERSADGMLVYRVVLPRAIVNGMQRQTVVTSDDIIHVRSVSEDGLRGIPLYRVARNDIATLLSIQRFTLTFFKNYARPGMAVILKRTLNDQALRLLRESFERAYSGDNAHRVAVLNTDADIKTFSINAREAELSDLFLQCIRNIAAFACVPSHLVGDPARTSYNSLEQENLSYLSQSLGYWLKAIEEEMNAKLLSEYEDDLFIEFERSALVQMDITTRYHAYQVGLQSGFLTRNEVRNRENMPDLPGGDRPFVPLNLAEGPAVENDADTDPASTDDVPPGQPG